MSEEQGKIGRVWLWRLVYAAPFLLAIAILAVLSAVNPFEIKAIGILMVFLLFYFWFLSIAFIVIRVGSRILRRMGFRSFVGTKKAYYLATVAAVLPVFLLALNSIGQLQVIDVVLVVALVALGWFYVGRRFS